MGLLTIRFPVRNSPKGVSLPTLLRFCVAYRLTPDQAVRMAVFHDLAPFEGISEPETVGLRPAWRLCRRPRPFLPASYPYFTLIFPSQNLPHAYSLQRVANFARHYSLSVEQVIHSALYRYLVNFHDWNFAPEEPDGPNPPPIERTGSIWLLKDLLAGMDE